MCIKDTKHNYTSQTIMCCDSFKEFIPILNWFQTEDKIYLMPYVQYDDKKLRINYCPSCGKCVRDIQIKEDDLIAFLK